MKRALTAAALKKESIIPELIKLAAFGIAFGYIEGAVAHYLRLHFYPHGLTLNLVIDLHTLLVEMGRELATLVVLLSVALLTKGPAIRRLANFVFIFAVWDIVYYGGLYLFEGWPKTLLDWDVLFLIPVPWFAPVIAPVAISLLGITGSLIILTIYKKFIKIKNGLLTVILLSGALISWLASFMLYPPSNQFPARYDWLLFFAGVLFASSGYARLIFLNYNNKNGKKYI